MNARWKTALIAAVLGALGTVGYTLYPTQAKPGVMLVKSEPKVAENYDNCHYVVTCKKRAAV